MSFIHRKIEQCWHWSKNWVFCAKKLSLTLSAGIFIFCYLVGTNLFKKIVWRHRADLLSLTVISQFLVINRNNVVRSPIGASSYGIFSYIEVMIVFCIVRNKRKKVLFYHSSIIFALILSLLVWFTVSLMNTSVFKKDGGLNKPIGSWDFIRYIVDVTISTLYSLDFMLYKII